MLVHYDSPPLPQHFLRFPQQFLLLGREGHLSLKKSTKPPPATTRPNPTQPRLLLLRNHASCSYAATPPNKLYILELTTVNYC